MLRMRTSGSQRAWQNWGRTVSAQPEQIVAPEDAHQVSALVAASARAGRRVKAVGSGHSFTPIAVTDGVLVELDRMSGITWADPSTGRVRVLAGTSLHALSQQLWSHGLALANLGDIDVQTIAGAIGTGTHGTGARFNGLASAVVGLQIVLADGSVVECDESVEPELFAAARIGLGALGIVTEVTLQCVPAYLMRATEEPDLLASIHSELDAFLESTDHVEFYWFPHTDRVLTKRNTRIPLDAPAQPLPRWRAWLDDEFLSNQVFGGLNWAASKAPGIVPSLNAISSRALSARTYTAPSYAVFASSRKVRFKEMEFAVPRAALGSVLDALVTMVEESSLRLPFPVEVRCAAADDVWLSTAYQQPTAYIAIHQYYRMPHAEYFDAFEEITASAGGRPHWGKMHGLDYQQLRQRVPRLDDFIAVRDRVDPHRTFTNPYLERILGS